MRHKLKIWRPLLVFTLVCGKALSAAGADEEEKPKQAIQVAGGAPVTITAETNEVEVAKTPSLVVVVDVEKIEQVGSNTLARALDFALPGRTASLGGFGTQASLFLNGARSADAVVLLDGIKLSNANLGLNMSNFNLSGIDRVEVLLGPASTLYGSDAHGGVISLSTRGPYGKPSFSGYLYSEANTHGHLRAGAMACYGWERGWVQGGGDAEEGPQSIKANNPFRQASGFLGFGRQFGEAWLLSASHRASYVGAPTPFHATTEYDENWNPLGTARYFDAGREALMWQKITTASLKGHFSNGLHGEFNAGSVSQTNVNDIGSEMPNAHASASKIGSFQANAKTTWKNSNSSVTGLVDYAKDTLKGFLDWPYSTSGDSSKGSRVALALEGSIEPLPELRLVASLRHQADAMAPNGEESISESQITWKTGVNILMPTGFRAYFSAGTAFNVPSLYQINTNKNAGKPRPGNESSSSVLAGIGYGHNKKWWFRADASRISYGRLLDWVPIDPGDPDNWSGYYTDLAELRIQGLEFAGGARGEKWDAEAWARTQEGRKMDEPKETQLMAAFQRRPFFSAGMRANYASKRLFCGINLSFIGHRYDYPLDGGPTANKTNYIDCSLRAGANIGKHLAITLRADRLFQDGISREDWLQRKDVGRSNVGIAQGFPSHGRSVGLEARYRF
jgi:outer membrane cobalamin receptor